MGHEERINFDALIGGRNTILSVAEFQKRFAAPGYSKESSRLRELISEGVVLLANNPQSSVIQYGLYSVLMVPESTKKFLAILVPVEYYKNSSHYPLNSQTISERMCALDGQLANDPQRITARELSETTHRPLSIKSITVYSIGQLQIK